MKQIKSVGPGRNGEREHGYNRGIKGRNGETVEEGETRKVNESGRTREEEREKATDQAAEEAET